MTVAEFIRVVEDVSFCGGLKAWGAKLEVRQDLSRTRVDLLMHFPWIPDRDTGEPADLHAVKSFEGEIISALTQERAVHFIRDALRWFMQHELDESLLFRGNRANNPHPAEDYLREREMAEVPRGTEAAG